MKIGKELGKQNEQKSDRKQKACLLGLYWNIEVNRWKQKPEEKKYSKHLFRLTKGEHNRIMYQEEWRGQESSEKRRAKVQWGFGRGSW